MTLAEWFVAILAAVGVVSLFTRGDSDQEGQLSRLEGKIDLLLEHQGLSYDPLEQPQGAVCLSVGGGPAYIHPRLLNLNIEPFTNVGVVGSAFDLPFRDGSVAAVHCEAVLEHLEYPDRAVQEMRRVLAPGGQVFAATPFLQVYHGYPDHFQNFTLNGHVRLFERAGFEVISSGPCVGPTFALIDIFSNYLRESLPTRTLSRSAYYLSRLALSPLRLFDRRLLRHASSSIGASSTFVHAVKPP